MSQPSPTAAQVAAWKHIPRAEQLVREWKDGTDYSLVGLIANALAEREAAVKTVLNELVALLTPPDATGGGA